MESFINFFSPLPKWSILILSCAVPGLIGLLIFAWKDYIAAACKFRETILSELEGLYPSPTRWPVHEMDIVNILNEKFPRLEIAVHTFKGHLPSCIAKRFNYAWIKYYNEYGQEDGQCYYHYVPFQGQSSSNGVIEEYDNTQTYKENFKENVERLLKYAKET